MQISAIKFSQIEDRIDAEYYKPDYLKVRKILLSYKLKIKDFADSFSGYAFPSEWFIQKDGVPVVKMTQVTNDWIIDLSKSEFLSPDRLSNFKKFTLNYNDIAIALTGATIGKSAIYRDKIASFLNQRVQVVRAKKISPYFLFILLSTKIFQSYIDYLCGGGARENVSPEVINNFPVFSVNLEKKIDKAVSKALNKRRLASEKYGKAEEILNKELRMTNLDLSTQKTFEEKFSNTNERIDPEYYQPKYSKFWKILKKVADLEKLEDIIVKIDYGTVPTSPYVSKEQGIPYIKGKDIKRNQILLDDLDYLHIGTKQLIKDKITQENDILITQMGTVGDAAVVPKEAAGFAFGSFILRIKLKDFSKTNPYYVAVVINSPVGKLQVFREMRISTVRANTDIPTIKNMIIPILPERIQQKISFLIKESFKLRKEAENLIQKVKIELEDSLL